MSKSKGNHIGLSDSADEQYGKVMSLPDDVVGQFFVLATNVDRTAIPTIMSRAASDPMGVKKQLARTIVAEFHGEEAARQAEERFERTVQRKEAPAEIPEFRIEGEQSLLDVIVAAGAVPSKREARRLFDQHAITINGEPVDTTFPATRGTVVQVGKRRWLRLV
jgi:tyrosyl-tRNA synthetase